jgi:hypothetical protein
VLASARYASLPENYQPSTINYQLSVLSADHQRLAQKGAELRLKLYRRSKIDYDNGSVLFDGYYSPISSKRKIEQAGFLVPHDCFVRFSKSVPFVPQLGKIIKITEGDTIFKLRIEEFPTHGASVEWAVGCQAIL